MYLCASHPLIRPLYLSDYGGHFRGDQLYHELQYNTTKRAGSLDILKFPLVVHVLVSQHKWCQMFILWLQSIIAKFNKLHIFDIPSTRDYLVHNQGATIAITPGSSPRNQGACT